MAQFTRKMLHPELAQGLEAHIKGITERAQQRANAREAYLLELANEAHEKRETEMLLAANKCLRNKTHYQYPFRLRALLETTRISGKTTLTEMASRHQTDKNLVLAMLTHAMHLFQGEEESPGFKRLQNMHRTLK